LDGDCTSACYDGNCWGGTQLIALPDEENHSSNAADGRGSITGAPSYKEGGIPSDTALPIEE